MRCAAPRKLSGRSRMYQKIRECARIAQIVKRNPVAHALACEGFASCKAQKTPQAKACATGIPTDHKSELGYNRKPRGPSRAMPPHLGLNDPLLLNEWFAVAWTSSLPENKLQACARAGPGSGPLADKRRRARLERPVRSPRRETFARQNFAIRKGPVRRLPLSRLGIQLGG